MYPLEYGKRNLLVDPAVDLQRSSGQRLLILKTVGRKCQYFKALIAVRPIQKLQTFELLCKKALACRIDDQQDFSFVEPKGHCLHVKIESRKIVNCPFHTRYLLGIGLIRSYSRIMFSISKSSWGSYRLFKLWPNIRATPWYKKADIPPFISFTKS